ncbi:thioredoxin family protein [Stygiobacter electus]|uniref:Thioredoxin family protein n=1 Tax=Stygiobacter electus TaxID=3032292 RepID=A0AAE3TDH3_9BACT|nr:thioredoxin family protein [Stygiobacter electus]MDF1612541.1 thioredoxin family protein [Stygiobacter electus]
MISVKVLGPGCSKCRTLEAKVRNIVSSNNIQADITKVEDINEMMSFGIMMTPGLVINEQVKSYGIVPKDEQILNWLKES